MIYEANRFNTCLQAFSQTEKAGTWCYTLPTGLQMRAREKNHNQYFQRTVPNDSQHIPNNYHLDIVTTLFSRWHFTAQRHRMYRHNLHSQSIHVQPVPQCKDYGVSFSVSSHDGLHSVKNFSTNMPFPACHGKKKKLQSAALYQFP